MFKTFITITTPELRTPIECSVTGSTEEEAISQIMPVVAEICNEKKFTDSVYIEAVTEEIDDYLLTVTVIDAEDNEYSADYSAEYNAETLETAKASIVNLATALCEENNIVGEITISYTIEKNGEYVEGEEAFGTYSDNRLKIEF